MIDFFKPPLHDVIEILLRDMNTGGNILFNGKQLTKKFLPTIKPRAQKSDAEKFFRTRSIAEVFTPTSVVKFMVDALDDKNFDSRWLEMACGEAPFITNRYDAESGKNIPFDARAGVLDKKLRAAKNFTQAKRAVQSVYGYELQGDSLLIARANVFLSFVDSVENFSDSNLAEIAEIIAWNFFQFDGLSEPDSLFGTNIIDWSYENRKFVFGGNVMKKFDFVISNPPYQEETLGDNKTFAPPVYNKFIDAAKKISDKAVFITPARFLFDAGGTPKDWNKKMLNDPHFKVLDYSPDASKYFKGVDIEGGVAITLHDKTQTFEPIGTFIHFEELRSICERVVIRSDFVTFGQIISGRTPYLFTDKLHEENPNAVTKLSDGHSYDISSNAFTALPEIFLNEKPSVDCLRVLGRLNNERAYCWIRKDFVRGRLEEYVGKWKIFVPKANGASGKLNDKEPARIISKPVIGEPLDICTDTFLVVGAFDTRAETDACLAYIKSKFARVMLGALKVTPVNPKATWSKVPLQDFTAASDIDWSGDVDEQLYRKYNLTAAQIKFIETHVKEMP